MTAPTRSQIEGNFIQPTYRVSVWNGSTFQDIADADILSVSGITETISERENALLTGDGVITRATIRTVSNATFPTNWKRARVFIYLSFSGAADVKAFFGYIVKKSRDGFTITYDCEGIIQTVLSSYKLHTSLYYRRYAATKTTVSSIEDPDNVNYAGGFLNEILWRCGGRPLTQSGTYSSAEWYYECDTSLLQLEWAWLAGEKLDEEIYRIARAAGGQIYQTNNNVIRYVQPFQFNAGSGFVIRDSYFKSYRESESTLDTVGSVRLTYTPRVLDEVQSVYKDESPKLIAPSSSGLFEAALQQPVYEWDSRLVVGSNITNSGFVSAIGFSSQHVTPTLLIHNRDAQRVRLTVTNPTTSPIVVNKIEFVGKPLKAAESQTYIYNRGATPEKNIEDNPYISTKQQAEQLTRMVYDYNATALPIITLGDCIYDPDRYVGETVTFISSLMSASGLYRIISISHDLGQRSELQLVSVSGLVRQSDVFIIGTTYAAGDIRRLSY